MVSPKDAATSLNTDRATWAHSRVDVTNAGQSANSKRDLTFHFNVLMLKRTRRLATPQRVTVLGTWRVTASGAALNSSRRDLRTIMAQECDQGWPNIQGGGGGPKATPLDRNYEKKYQKVKRSKNSNHPPEHSRTHTHTHTLLQSYQWWSIACRLSEVKVISGWLIYRRCSFCAGFTSCTSHDTAKGIVSASSRILHLSQYTVIQCYIPPMGLMHLHL